MSETIVLEEDRMIDPSVEERWDGANGNVEKFDVKVQAELLSRGGRSYMRFYTGDYSSEAFEKFLRSVFSGVYNTSESAPRSWVDQVARYPNFPPGKNTKVKFN